jgi:hypothetical protein
MGALMGTYSCKQVATGGAEMSFRSIFRHIGGGIAACGVMALLVTLCPPSASASVPPPVAAATAGTGAQSVSTVKVNDNVCIGPVVVNETLTVHRDPTTRTHSGTADFVSPGGLSEDYPFSYVVDGPYQWSGTIVLVDDSPFLSHTVLLHVKGSVGFSEGGYIVGIQGARFNICKVFGDPGATRL